jgi:hypothetical protein
LLKERLSVNKRETLKPDAARFHLENRLKAVEVKGEYQVNISHGLPA